MARVTSSRDLSTQPLRLAVTVVCELRMTLRMADSRAFRAVGENLIGDGFVAEKLLDANLLYS